MDQLISCLCLDNVSVNDLRTLEFYDIVNSNTRAKSFLRELIAMKSFNESSETNESFTTGASSRGLSKSLNRQTGNEPNLKEKNILCNRDSTIEKILSNISSEDFFSPDISAALSTGECSSKSSLIHTDLVLPTLTDASKSCRSPKTQKPEIYSFVRVRELPSVPCIVCFKNNEESESSPTFSSKDLCSSTSKNSLYPILFALDSTKFKMTPLFPLKKLEYNFNSCIGFRLCSVGK